MEFGTNLGSNLDSLMPLKIGKGRETLGVSVDHLQAAMILAQELLQKDYGVSLTDIEVTKHIMTMAINSQTDFATPAIVAYPRWLNGWHEPYKQEMKSKIHDRRVKLPDPVKQLKQRQDEFADKVFDLMMAQEALKEMSKNGRLPDENEVIRLVAEAKGEKSSVNLPDQPTQMQTEPDDRFPNETYGEYVTRVLGDKY